MPRILVTGKDGQLGFALQRSLAGLGDVHMVGRQDCDLTNSAEIRALVRSIRPDFIVNPAAYTAVDKAESDRSIAFAVNATAPLVLAEAAAEIGALLIHYSTDYVFDGCKTDGYVESDTCNPLSVYGESKLAGESAVSKVGGRHLIFRTSWVYGEHGANFLKTILRLATQRDTLQVVSDQIGTPTSATLISNKTADVIKQIISFGDDIPAGQIMPNGVYHLTASGSTNWHAYAQFIVRTACELGIKTRLLPEAISAISTEQYPVAAARPRSSRLNTNKLSTALGVSLPDWELDASLVINNLLK